MIEKLTTRWTGGYLFGHKAGKPRAWRLVRLRRETLMGL